MSENCVDIEPQTNIKCIWFTMLIVGIYWFLPRNKYILVFLLWAPYLWMAWYDMYYVCQKGTFGPTYLRSYYEWAKPYDSEQLKAYRNWCPKHARKVFIVDVVIAIVLVIVYFTFFRHWNPKV